MAGQSPSSSLTEQGVPLKGPLTAPANGWRGPGVPPWGRWPGEARGGAGGEGRDGASGTSGGGRRRHRQQPRAAPPRGCATAAAAATVPALPAPSGPPCGAAWSRARPAAAHGWWREGRDGTSPVGKKHSPCFGKVGLVFRGGRGRLRQAKRPPPPGLAPAWPGTSPRRAERAGPAASLPRPQALFSRRRPRTRFLCTVSPRYYFLPASSSGTRGCRGQNSAWGWGGGGFPPASRPAPSRLCRGAGSPRRLSRCRPAWGCEGTAKRWVSSLATSPLVLLCGVGGWFLVLFFFFFFAEGEREGGVVWV